MLDTLVNTVRDAFRTTEPDPADPQAGVASPTRPLSEGSDELLTGPEVLALLDAEWVALRERLAKDLRFGLSATYPQGSVRITASVYVKDPDEELTIASR